MTQADNEHLEQLARGVALSDKPSFYIMLYNAPEAAAQGLEALRRRSSELRGEAVLLSRVDPSAEPGGMPSVLRRLAPPDGAFAAHKIVVLDASKAASGDSEAWGGLFRRMNELRNNLLSGTGTGAVEGQLVLCMPRWMAPVFTFNAPDFWSVRSYSAVIDEGAAPRLSPATPKPGMRG